MLRITVTALLPGALLLLVAMPFIGGGYATTNVAPPACATFDEYTVADATHTHYYEWSRPTDGDRPFFDWVYTSSLAPKPGLVVVGQIGSFWAYKDTDLRGETINASLPPDAGVDAVVGDTRVVHGALKLVGCGR